MGGPNSDELALCLLRGLERLTGNVKVATGLGSMIQSYSILRHKGIRGASDEALLHKVHFTKILQSSPLHM